MTFIRVPNINKPVLKPIHVNQYADYLENVDPTNGIAERIRDVMGTDLVAGSNVTITVDDDGNTITIGASGGGASMGGFIDARDGGLSTASADNSATLATLLTTAASEGKTLWIPEGVYRGTANVPANARIDGVGTLKPVAAGTGFVLRVSGANTQIRGITIDGENTAKGISVDPYTGVNWIAGSNTHIEGVTLQNIALEYAVYFNGTTDLLVKNCKLTNVAAGIGGYNTQRLRVHGNVIDSPTGNALGMVAQSSNFFGCEWKDNIVVNAKRMGLEPWTDGTGWIIAPIISGNHVTMSTSSASPTGELIAYSIVGCKDPIVTDNVAVAPNDYARYSAFELANATQTVKGNSIYGTWTAGIVIGWLSVGCQITENLIAGAKVGISSIYAGNDVLANTISHNTIRNFWTAGILLAHEQTGRDGGHVVENNTIIHDQDHAGVTRWAGIHKGAGGWDFPGKINRNTIIQTLAVPSGTVQELGIWMEISNLGEMAGTEVKDNHGIDLATTTVLNMLAGWGPNISDMTVSGNQLTDSTSATTAPSWVMY